MPVKNEKSVTDKEIKKRTIQSFIIFFLLIAAAVIGWKWLNKQPENNGMPAPLRAVLNKNESLFNNVIFNESTLSKIYPAAAAVPEVRVNGEYGMGDNFDAAKWKLKVVKSTGDTLLISLDEIKALPKTDIVFASW